MIPANRRRAFDRLREASRLHGHIFINGTFSPQSRRAIFFAARRAGDAELAGRIEERAREYREKAGECFAGGKTE